MQPLNMNTTRLIGIASVALVILVIALYVKEFDHFNRTLQGGVLAHNAALTGMGVGMLLGGVLAWRISDADDRLPAFFAPLFAGLLLGPLAGSLSNRLCAAPEVISSEVEFHLEEMYYAELYGFLRGGRTDPGYRSFFYLNNRLYKVQTRQPMFDGKYRGDKVVLPLRHGFWGFDFVPTRNS